MEAIERAPARDLDGHFERRAFPEEMLVNQACQFSVSCRLHVERFSFPFS